MSRSSLEKVTETWQETEEKCVEILAFGDDPQNQISEYQNTHIHYPDGSLREAVKDH